MVAVMLGLTVTFSLPWLTMDPGTWAPGQGKHGAGDAVADRGMSERFYVLLR